jgi:hypothetical protein
MANNLMTFENVVENIVPKVTIQRIILETSATDVPSDPVDPHATPVGVSQAFTNPTFSLDEDSDRLKVSLILSLKGFGSKNLKRDNILSNIFDNADLLSMVKSRIYQIDDMKSLEIARQNSATPITSSEGGISGIDQAPIFGGGAGLGNLGQGKGADPDTINYSLDNISTVELYNIISSSPELFIDREINLSEEMSSYSKEELTRFQTIDSAGSVIYNFPFRIDPFLLSKNSKLLAYMVVTEIDSELLLDKIKATIGGTSDFVLPSEVKEYVEEFNNDVNNKTISFDFVINDGDVNKTAALLKRDDNGEFWFGSYHEMSDGTLMTGNSHNDMTISPKNRNVVLEPVLLANTKIVDLRDDEEIEKVFLKEVYKIESLYDEVIKKSKQAKKSDKNTLEEMQEMFSTSYKSIESNGNCSYLFGIDKLKILKYKSLLPGVAQNLIKFSDNLTLNNFLQEVVKEILDATNIRYLNVFRRRIKINKFGSNKLGTQNPSEETFKHNILNADINNSYEDSKLVKIATTGENIPSPNIKKIEALNSLDNSIAESRFSHYSFKDSLLDAQQGAAVFLKTGNYEYSYELVLEDGISKVLTSKLTSMINSQAKIKDYLKFINENITNCYDGNTEQFNSDFINNSEYSNIGATIDDVLSIMIPIMIMLNSETDLETYGKFGSTLTGIAHPAQGSFQGLLKFIKIADTFIDKIQKLPGVKTGLKKYLDLAVTNLQSDTPQIPDTMKVNETFPDHVSLDDYATGYEYLIPTKNLNQTLAPMSANSLRTIPLEIYRGIIAQQIEENFQVNSANTSLGSPDNPNVSRFFTPAKVFVSQRGYQTKAFPGTFLKPHTLNLNYYKPIILDMVDYHLTKNIKGKYNDPDPDSNIKRLIEIASYYGINLQGWITETLQYLSDPTVDNQESGDQFYDSSNSGNLQQQSTKNVNLSGIDFEDETDPASEYEDTQNIEEKKNLNVENLLFGILSNIILQYELPLPNDYILPNITVENISSLPNPIQSLFVQYNKQGFVGGDLKQYLAGPTIGEYVKIREFPLNLNTVGWWWFNYSNIADIRYISQYDGFFNPIWSPLTLDALANTVEQGKRIICKIFKYENSSLGIKSNNMFLNLPTLNEHFIIEPSPGLEIKSSQQEQQLFVINEENDADLQETSNKSLQIVYNNFGKDLNSVLNTDRKVVKNANARNMQAKDLTSLQRPSSRSGRPTPTRRGKSRVREAQSRQSTGRIKVSDRGSNY